jgi:predicted O-methyltransferase YrrM
MTYLQTQMGQVSQWARLDTELDNFYYGLTAKNRSDLAQLIAIVVGCDVAEIDRYIDELVSDSDLENHIKQARRQGDFPQDSRIAFGRREGWYAFIRALKPRIVVETGVHHGLGAVVIAAALLRNLSEGYEGRYFGTDLDPGAGVLFTEPYSSVGQILYGDSLDSLNNLDSQVDVFINDSDHSGDYERAEYEAIIGKLSSRSLILGDNAHVTSELDDFARKRNRSYLFFSEKPEGHWYPGAGIGISPSQIPLRKTTA